MVEIKKRRSDSNPLMHAAFLEGLNVCHINTFYLNNKSNTGEMYGLISIKKIFEKQRISNYKGTDFIFDSRNNINSY